MEAGRILSHFVNEAGETAGTPLELPLNVTVKQLELICNQLVKQDEHVPYTFFIDDTEVVGSLEQALGNKERDTEKVLRIVYQPQAVFRVRPVTRCTSSLPGHAEAVVSASFSPDGRHLASGSGDKTVRFWDVNTETPHFVCEGHSNWVLCVAWAPDGKKLASGCKNGEIILWDPCTGRQTGRSLLGHKQWITSLAWEPLHCNGEARRLASASKDATIRIWDVILGQTVFSLTGHAQCVTCIRWGGSGLVYSASQDRTIKIWRASDAVLCRTLQGHGHWVNTLALSTDYALRTGSFDPRKADVVYADRNETAELAREKAQELYDRNRGGKPERLVSGSDDFTLHLWHPETSKQAVARMTGHQQLVNDVCFSPDGRLVASASFDKSVKIWDGFTGKFLASLRGHVQAVYRVSWASDSRLLVSGSADSTLKVWDMSTKKILLDLPGHADEVYAVDWSPDGQRVVSGGKDKVLKIWRK